MTSKEIQAILKALPIVGAKVRTFSDMPAGAAIDLPFSDQKGMPLSIYALHRNRSRKISLVGMVRLYGDPNAEWLAALMKSYGVTLVLDRGRYLIREESSRRLPERLRALVQATLAVDGFVRGIEIHGKLRRAQSPPAEDRARTAASPR